MTESADQERVFSFLMDRAAAGGAGASRTDTHIAAVFLAGERAYKVKKAVRFPYLDFSTLEKRKAASEHELEINRRFAPDLYLGLVPVTEEKNGLALNGAGTPIEWVIVMKRFDMTLDEFARKNGISDTVAEELAEMVARLHAAAPPFDAARWIANLPHIIHDNDTDLQRSRELFGAGRVDRLRDSSLAQLARNRALLERRGRAGFVREAHGDLHLGNIAVIDGRPVPFDALEFDSLLAAGDVLYDLAYLLMSLIEQGEARAANIVLNRYLIEAKRDEHLDGLSLLPLFLSLRAAIRAKVLLAKAEQRQAHEASRACAKQYFEHALDFLSPSAPVLIAVGGLSGTGKSVLARSLAPFVPPQPGALVLRSDVERKAMFGVPETSVLPQDAYAAEVSVKVYQRLCEKAKRALAAGHSTILDAVFSSGSERDLVEAIAREAGVKLFGLFLEAGLETRLRRVKDRTRDASDADAAVAERQERFVMRPVRWNIIDAAGSREQTLAHALDAIGVRHGP